MDFGLRFVVLKDQMEFTEHWADRCHLIYPWFSSSVAVLRRSETDSPLFVPSALSKAKRINTITIDRASEAYDLERVQEFRLPVG